MRTSSVRGRQHCVIAIGKISYRWPLATNELDVQVYASLRRALGLHRVYLIAQGTTARTCVGHAGATQAILLGRRKAPLDTPMFLIRAVTLAIRVARGRNAIILSSDPLISGFAALIAKRLAGIPAVVQIQGDLFDPPLQLPRWKRFAMRVMTVLVSRRADAVRCVSMQLVDKAVRFGILRAKVTYVPSRCDTTRFTRSSYRDSAAAIREHLAITRDEKVVLFVGGLNVHKGISHLLGGFERVLRTEPQMRLVVVGSGALLADAMARTRMLRIDHAVTFVGQVPYWDVPVYMACADVLVLPSLDEGMPRVVLEALSMELPVVASRVGGIPDVIRNDVGGLLVTPGDEAALAAAMIECVRHPDRFRMREARRRIIDAFGFESGIRQYADLLRPLIDR